MNQPYFFCNKREQKAALIRAQGKFLADRLNGEHFVYLFSVDSFFAEIWYRRDNYEVDLVLSFKSLALLEPYLEEVNIAPLLGL
ncbi:hypothetical protein AHMF7605_20125 [Adhaeribacter arboris]|uniref:Uncharacterized protein n=1 Tax=Adhaeribacter arboris TaxID=2072846 RepID=A0A2T2YJG4_9BACT|nr:hypothetical protein [Adhaeribacter arboris]PSR55648.1 hypothetical protein AHMF7605_20125 [Adhaeribacter arboris]